MTNEKFAAYENLGRNIIAHLIANGKFPADKCWQLDAMLETFGYDKLGLKGMFANELKMLCVKHCAYETKNNHAKPIEYVFAKVLEMRDINLSVLNDLHFSTKPSEAQLEHIQHAKDSISIKVNASEAGTEPAKRTVSNNGARPEYNKRIDPALSAAIAKASKPNEQYRFDLLLSTLEEEGFHVELKGDVAEVYVDADGKRVEAGIIRYSSPVEMAEDLSALCNKCPLFTGQRRINVSVVINKVLDNKEENTMENNVDKTIKDYVKEAEAAKEENDMDNYAEAMQDAYADLAGMEPPVSGMRIDFNILVKGKETATSRWITIKQGEIGKSEYFMGFVYNGRNNYVGCWQWKLAYRHPQFGPAGQKDLLGKQFWLCYGNGNSNVARLILAIEKALNTKGVKTKRKDHETWVIGVVPDTRRSVTGPTENVFPGPVNTGEDAI